MPVEFVDGEPLGIVLPGGRGGPRGRDRGALTTRRGTDNVWKEATLENGVKALMVPPFIDVGEADPRRDRVRDLSQVHAFTDFVGVLLDARTDPEHGRMSVRTGGHPRLLVGTRTLVSSFFEREAHTVGGEDPAIDARLPLDRATGTRRRYVRSNDSSVHIRRPCESQGGLGRDPAEVDLGVAQLESAPRRLVVGRHAHFDLEPCVAGGLHRREPFDVSDGALGRLANGEPAVEAEREAIRHGAIARRWSSAHEAVRVPCPRNASSRKPSRSS